MRAYCDAKSEAEERLRASDLEFTIVRPGPLTDEPGRGTITAARHAASFGKVSRDDVVATSAETLTAANTLGKTFEVIGGDTPIPEAVRRL